MAEVAGRAPDTGDAVTEYGPCGWTEPHEAHQTAKKEGAPDFSQVPPRPKIVWQKICPGVEAPVEPPAEEGGP